jgi:nicotinate-nucleotide pyrophosphorylase
MIYYRPLFLPQAFIEKLSVSIESLSNGKLPLEASGNIDENTILAVAKTGVDYISTGSITKNIQAIDLSLRFPRCL